MELNLKTMNSSWTTMMGDEQEVSAAEVMTLTRRAYRWSCPGCHMRLPFTGRDVEPIPFLIVRHLVREHGISAGRIAAAEPALADEVQQYCQQMRLGDWTPAYEE